MVSPETGTTPANAETVAEDRHDAARTSLHNAIRYNRDAQVANHEGQEAAVDAGVRAVLTTLDQLQAPVSFQDSEAAVSVAGDFAQGYVDQINS